MKMIFVNFVRWRARTHWNIRIPNRIWIVYGYEQRRKFRIKNKWNIFFTAIRPNFNRQWKIWIFFRFSFYVFDDCCLVVVLAGEMGVIVVNIWFQSREQAKWKCFTSRRRCDTSVCPLRKKQNIHREREQEDEDEWKWTAPMVPKFLFLSGDAKCKIVVKMNSQLPIATMRLFYLLAHSIGRRWCRRTAYRISEKCVPYWPTLLLTHSLHKICAKNGNCDRRQDVECECGRARNSANG